MLLSVRIYSSEQVITDTFTDSNENKLIGFIHPETYLTITDLSNYKIPSFNDT